MWTAMDSVFGVEIVLKDISTVSYHSERLWDWAKIAREEADRFGE